MKIFLTLVVAALAAAVLLRGLIAVAEPRMVFFPLAGEGAAPASLGIPFAVVHLATADGETLNAWQLEPEDPIADVVYFHGNGGNLSVWLPVLSTLHHFRLRVLAVDYRGYGLSSGTPSEDGLYRDAEAVVRHVARQTRPAGRPLVFWGRSLGGPVAASATRVVAPDGLILESSFADKAAVVRSQPILRLLNSLSRYRFPTADLLTAFTNPVLVVHGNRDSIIPFALGRELFERLRPPRQFVEVEGADHNDLFDVARESYWRPVLEFVAGLSAQ